MVWEWGLDTIENGTKALLKVIKATGYKAGLNYDGKTIEYLAITSQNTIAELRDALNENTIEIWGGTFTQPYGGIIGHESNIRQRVMGIRSFENILGKRPKIFAEEEFDVFPQLPQILNQLGYKGVILFPQHTWHTPTFPFENDSTITWRGLDGAMVPAIPLSSGSLMRGIPTALKTMRNHSGPQDVLFISWLEILDKPNWMWDSNFVISIFSEMNSQNDIEIMSVHASEFLQNNHTNKASVREYTLDDYFHGISCGKNGDNLVRSWRLAEESLLQAEFLATWCSYLGSPYPQYDAYPEWELDDAWRHLLQSQGHDAYECEGLTNFAGKRYAQLSLMRSKDVQKRCEQHLFKQNIGSVENYFIIKDPLQAEGLEVEFGRDGQANKICFNGNNLVASPVGLPRGWFASKTPVKIERKGTTIVTTEIKSNFAEGTLKWTYNPNEIALKGQLNLFFKSKPEPGILKSVTLPIRTPQPVKKFLVDSPFAVTEVHPNGLWVHRQPSGYWLTSQQWEEWIKNPITYLSFICLQSQDIGLQYVSRQNVLAIGQENGFDAVIFGYDAWDQENWRNNATCDFAILPAFDISKKSLLERSANVWARRFNFNGYTFVSCEGNAFITGIRRVGEECEIRCFETEGETSKIEFMFPWEIAMIRKINLMGETLELVETAYNNKAQLQMQPYEIVSLRVKFKGKEVEYPPIKEYRSIWVGEN